MHDAADDEARGRAAGQVEGGAVLHPKMFDQAPLGKEVRGQLDGATKSSADHRCSDTPVKSLDAFIVVDLP